MRRHWPGKAEGLFWALVIIELEQTCIGQLLTGVRYTLNWKRKEGENKHHDAYATEDADTSNAEKDDDSNYDKLLEKYSPQEIALLRSLQHEKQYRATLKQNDGKRKSPQTHNRSTIAIDEQDQFTPDNWVSRESNLTRLTDKHHSTPKHH